MEAQRDCKAVLEIEPANKATRGIGFRVSKGLTSGCLYKSYKGIGGYSKGSMRAAMRVFRVFGMLSGSGGAR